MSHPLKSLKSWHRVPEDEVQLVYYCKNPECGMEKVKACYSIPYMRAMGWPDNCEECDEKLVFSHVEVLKP